MTQGLNMNSAEAQILAERTQHMQADIGRAVETMQDIQRKLELLPAMSASVEHLRADLVRSTTAARDHEKRIQQIEQQLPGLAELRRWVIGGVLASVGMMGTALVKLVLVDPLRDSAPKIVYAQPPKDTAPQPAP